MPAAPAPTMMASTQPERGTSGAGRGAANAGAAVRTAAEEARKDRRLRRLMAHAHSVKRCEVYHGTRATRVLNLFPPSPPCLRYRHSDALFEVSATQRNEGRQTMI